VNQPSTIVHERSTSMLRSALGSAIAAWLDDNGISEVMLNADGRLWVDRLDSGMAVTGERLTPTQAERIIRLVAHHVGAEVHRASPRVSAELPESGERFEGLLPPVVTQPVFSIRRPASLPLTLSDYVIGATMSAAAAAYLTQAVRSRANILVAGGTSTGKTTLTNALLAVASDSADRIILIEDTRELRCDAANVLALRTAPGVTMTDLVRSSLRLRPDRIPIGEVRGPEALDLLKAWGTGHPGGIGTIHAGTTMAALHRLEQLVLEAIPHVPRPLIAETINVIAVLTGRGSERRLSELVRVEGLDAAGAYRLLPALASQGASV
jgi:type IV secretion system protein VirB11